jgi:type I restriction enzyme M protein
VLDALISQGTALIVPKEKIAENGDYNLSGERYRVGVSKELHYPIVKLSELAENLDSKRVPITKGDRIPGSYPYYGASGIVDMVDGFIFDEDILLVSEDGANLLARSTPIAFSVSGKCWVNNHAHVLRFQNSATQKLIELYLNSISIEQYVTGAAQPKLNQQAPNNIQISLPPLEVQKEIVAEIEGYQKVINGARAVLDNYRPHFSIHPDWPVIDLGDVCDIKTGKPNSNAAVIDGAYPFFTCSKEVFQIDRYAFDCEAILLSGNNASGNFDVKHYCGKFNAYQRTYVITVKAEFLDKITYGILKYILDANLLDLKKKSIGGLTQYLTLGMITSINLPLPTLATQQAIVAEIEAEQALVAANRELITRFEKKIQATLTRIWGEEV